MILLWVLIAIMNIVAMGFVAYPLFANQQAVNFRATKFIWLLLLMLPLTSVSLYWFLGQSKQVAAWYAQQQHAAKLRQELGSPDQVIARLKQHLQAEPASKQGWYLLGRLYFSQQQFAQAAKAYARLSALEPDNPDFLVQYAQALYFADKHYMSAKTVKLLQRVLTLDAENSLAINLLAINAYRQAKYAQAIQYWQQLLNHYPPDSDDYQALATAIENARLALQRQGTKAEPATVLTIRVDIAAQLKRNIAADDTVFVYAREAGNTPIPLAVSRFAAQQLPKEVTLTENMAMNPSHTLAKAKAVIVIARISKSGNAAPKPGDLQGKSSVIVLGQRPIAPIHIIINEQLE